ncbi:DUF2809 domain-containing protein [Microbacterium sp. P07]|uniref:ribosomal maturation YjgA family protein n=1 Tax=Microbacterium sp. P07 TaxID=3366952 RepID=UPI003745BAD8
MRGDGKGAPRRRHAAPRRRLAAAVALAAVIAAGLVVHALLPDSAGADVAGDALYAVAVYAGLVVLFPAPRPPLIGAIAAAWCLSIELFQLTGVPLALAAAFPPIVLVLGTGFDARDLVVYSAAAAAAAAIDLAVARQRGMTAADQRLEPT